MRADAGSEVRRGEVSVPSAKSRRAAAIITPLLGLACFACGTGGTGGGGGSGPTGVDCGALASRNWVIQGLNSLIAEDPSGAAPVILRMNVGGSVKLDVEPDGALVSTECAAHGVESVAWTVTNPSVATVSAAGTVEAWLSATGLGDTGLGARIQFKGGTSRDVRPQFFFSTGFVYRDVDRLRMVPAAPPTAGSLRILEGRVRLGLYSQTTTDWRVTMPFTVAEQGSLNITVDWTDPRSNVTFVALGPCPGACVVVSPKVPGVKPVTAGSPRVAPGPYTLRLDNLTTTEEAASYEVWLTPGG